jgi:hypothetical protein
MKKEKEMTSYFERLKMFLSRLRYGRECEGNGGDCFFCKYNGRCPLSDWLE